MRVGGGAIRERGLFRFAPKAGGRFLQGFGLLFGAIALAFFVVCVKDASAKRLTLRKSPGGQLCGTLEETRPWGTTVRDLPPGSVLRLQSAMEIRKEAAPGRTVGRNWTNSKVIRVQVEVLIVTTTTDDIHLDYPGAAVYARAVLDSAPGGPPRTAESDYPAGILAVTVLSMAVGALLFLLGRREAMRAGVPPPA